MHVLTYYSATTDRLQLNLLSLHFTTVVLVDQDVSVSSTAVVHVGDSLVDVVHGPSLGPSLDLVITGKLQHLGDGGGRRSNSGSTVVDVTYIVSWVDVGRGGTHP